MKEYCTRCGKPFDATGRGVICPACKEQAVEEFKKAATLRVKQASWRGESVPVRISGRSSTVIRAYEAANNLSFAAALVALLKASDYFKSVGKSWEEVEPYKSRRRDKSTTEDEQEVKTASKPQAAKAAKVSKTAAGKAGKKEGK